MCTSTYGTHARGTDSGFRREELKLGQELQKQGFELALAMNQALKQVLLCSPSPGREKHEIQRVGGERRPPDRAQRRASDPVVVISDSLTFQLVPSDI